MAGARPPGKALFALLCVIWLTGCAVSRNHEALLALADVAAGTGPSRLKQATEEPRRSEIVFREGGVEYRADLYVPADANPEAGIVLVPGAVPEGKDDERLVAFAKTLARLRFAVVAPELSGYRQLKIRPRHADEVAAAVRYLASEEQWSPEGRVGIGAFSYGAGPALAAALQDGARERVRFVLAIGGYHDLQDAIRYFTTGVAGSGDTEHRAQASEYGKLVFIRSTVDLLSNPRDRELLEAMTHARLKDPGADISGLARDLGPEGRSVFEVLENHDPARTDALIARLPAAVRATLDQLTLSNKPLDRLQARLILVHGKDDRLIPYTESLALARAAPEGQAKVFVIERILSHVDLGFSAFFSRRFWSEELPDAWRLWRAQALLLKERELEAPAGRPGLAP
jgi:acetyl esterase/lipase